MGGKGQRRREMNFRQYHGGDKRLPSRPNLKEIDAIPSKLRLLIQIRDFDFKNASSLKTQNRDTKKEKENAPQKGKHKDDCTLGKKVVAALESKDRAKATQGDEKKKKGKGKRFDELHAQSLGLASDQHITRRKRKKEYLDARKKKNKNKNKKLKNDYVSEFPGHEDIKFGEESFASHSLSNERLCLKAVEAYREHRQSYSRPGFHFPGGVVQPPSSS